MHCSEVDETATGSANFWSDLLSAATVDDKARAGGAQLATSDRLSLDCAERVPELPAVEPGAAQRRAELEVRLECREDPLEGMQVLVDARADDPEGRRRRLPE